MPEISIQNFTVLQTRLDTGTQEVTLPCVKNFFWYISKIVFLSSFP